MRSFKKEEKGKGKLTDQPTRPRIRIRASDLDTSRLIRENSLTLIGRVTNRREQNMASLLPYLTRKWNLVGRTHGSDLGNDCFQFRFQDEKDMRTVLENRPYQFNRWMIILQQWEPVISPTFPSQIPFWINLKGIPLHFWDERVIRDIGQELGHLESYSLTQTTARVKVMMDGLKPLPQDTVLEFSAGEECVITLEYEKLENFCNYCMKLSHLAHDCPIKLLDGAQETRKRDSSLATEESVPRTYFSQRHQSHNQLRRDRQHSPTRQEGDSAFHRRVDRHGNPFGARATTYLSRAPPLRNKITPPTETEAPRQRRLEKSPPHRQTSGTSPQYSVRRPEQSRGHLNRTPCSTPDQQWRPKEPQLEDIGAREPTPDFSRAPLERNLDKEDFPPPQPIILPPIRSTHEIMEELREVTYQYTNCADPVESAARRQRVLDGETHDMMAKTAAAMVETEQECQQAYLAALGTAVVPENLIDTEQNETNPLELSQPAQSHKRRGRPPKPKPKQREIRVSPKVFKGASSRKRNLTTLAVAAASPANHASNTTNRPVRRSNKTGSEASRSESTPSRPQTLIFPASTRQPRDFPRQSPPLP